MISSYAPGRSNRRICCFPVAISSYVSEIMSALIAHYDHSHHTPFCISAGTNEDNLEWLQLKLRFTDDMLDLRMLWISELAMSDWMTVSEKKGGQWTVISEHTRFVRVFTWFSAEGWRTTVKPLNLVIIHIMHHHVSDILRCVAIWNMYYFESSTAF